MGLLDAIGGAPRIDRFARGTRQRAKERDERGGVRPIDRVFLRHPADSTRELVDGHWVDRTQGAIAAVRRIAGSAEHVPAPIGDGAVTVTRGLLVARGIAP